MTAPPVWKRGFVTTAAVLVVVLGVDVAHADVAFRKKAPAATDDTGLEGTPSGGSSDGTAPAEGSPSPSALQAEDKDTPEAQAEREKARADAALARQLKNQELAKAKEPTPYYKTWPFWAITGLAVVGVVGIIWGTSAILSPDIAACPRTSTSGCYGEGR